MKTQVKDWSGKNKCREEKKRGEGREYGKEELSLKAIWRVIWKTSTVESFYSMQENPNAVTNQWESPHPN